VPCKPFSVNIYQHEVLFAIHPAPSVLGRLGEIPIGCLSHAHIRRENPNERAGKAENEPIRPYVYREIARS